MSAAIVAWQTYSPLGHGAAAHTQALRDLTTAVPLHGTALRTEVQDFDVREILGRAGTRLMDRVAGLAVATTHLVLRQALPGLGPYQPEEVGLVLGANDGMHSVMAFVRDTWTRSKPYDVDPSHVPRTLMNFAAGQCAIWHGIKGPNTTICGSQVTGLLTLNYALRLQRYGHASAVLCGAVEECSPDRAAVEAARSGPEPQPTGEGCVMFLLEAPGSPRPALAEVLAVEFGVYLEPDGLGDAMAHCLRTALRRAGVDAAQVRAVAPSAGQRGAQETKAAIEVLRNATVHTATVDRLGDTRAVSACFQLVELLVEATGTLAAVTSSDAEGRVGCALLRINGH